MTPKYDIEVELSGHDGNAFAILGAVAKAMRKHGCTPEQIAEYHDAAMVGDYDHLLRVTGEYVGVS